MFFGKAMSFRSHSGHDRGPKLEFSIGLPCNGQSSSNRNSAVLGGINPGKLPAFNFASPNGVNSSPDGFLNLGGAPFG